MTDWYPVDRIVLVGVPDSDEPWSFVLTEQGDVLVGHPALDERHPLDLLPDADRESYGDRIDRAPRTAVTTARLTGTVAVAEDTGWTIEVRPTGIPDRSATMPWAEVVRAARRVRQAFAEQSDRTSSMPVELDEHGLTVSEGTVREPRSVGPADETTMREQLAAPSEDAVYPAATGAPVSRPSLHAVLGPRGGAGRPVLLDREGRLRFGPPESAVPEMFWTAAYRIRAAETAPDFLTSDQIADAAAMEEIGQQSENWQTAIELAGFPALGVTFDDTGNPVPTLDGNLWAGTLNRSGDDALELRNNGGVEGDLGPDGPTRAEVLARIELVAQQLADLTGSRVRPIGTIEVMGDEPGSATGPAPGPADDAMSVSDADSDFGPGSGASTRGPRLWDDDAASTISDGGVPAGTTMPGSRLGAVLDHLRRAATRSPEAEELYRGLDQNVDELLGAAEVALDTVEQHAGRHLDASTLTAEERENRLVELVDLALEPRAAAHPLVRARLHPGGARPDPRVDHGIDESELDADVAAVVDGAHTERSERLADVIARHDGWIDAAEPDGTLWQTVADAMGRAWDDSLAQRTVVARWAAEIDRTAPPGWPARPGSQPVDAAPVRLERGGDPTALGTPVLSYAVALFAALEAAQHAVAAAAPDLRYPLLHRRQLEATLPRVPSTTGETLVLRVDLGMDDPAEPHGVPVVVDMPPGTPLIRPEVDGELRESLPAGTVLYRAGDHRGRAVLTVIAPQTTQTDSFAVIPDVRGDGTFTLPPFSEMTTERRTISAAWPVTTPVPPVDMTFELEHELEGTDQPSSAGGTAVIVAVPAGATVVVRPQATGALHTVVPAGSVVRVRDLSFDGDAWVARLDLLPAGAGPDDDRPTDGPVEPGPGPADGADRPDDAGADPASETTPAPRERPQTTPDDVAESPDAVAPGAVHWRQIDAPELPPGVRTEIRTALRRMDRHTTDELHDGELDRLVEFERLSSGRSVVSGSGIGTQDARSLAPRLLGHYREQDVPEPRLRGGAPGAAQSPETLEREVTEALVLPRLDWDGFAIAAGLADDEVGNLRSAASSVAAEVMGDVAAAGPRGRIAFELVTDHVAVQLFGRGEPGPDIGDPGVRNAVQETARHFAERARATIVVDDTSGPSSPARTDAGPVDVWPATDPEFRELVLRRRGELVRTPGAADMTVAAVVADDDVRALVTRLASDAGRPGPTFTELRSAVSAALVAYRWDIEPFMAGRVGGWRRAHQGLVDVIEGWAEDRSGGTLRDRLHAMRSANEGGFIRGVPFTSWDERALTRIWVEAGLVDGRTAADLTHGSGGLTTADAISGWQDRYGWAAGPVEPGWDVASMTADPGFRELVLAERARLMAGPGVLDAAWDAALADAGIRADVSRLAEERGHPTPSTRDVMTAASRILAGDADSGDAWLASDPAFQSFVLLRRGELVRTPGRPEMNQNALLVDEGVGTAAAWRALDAGRPAPSRAGLRAAVSAALAGDRWEFEPFMAGRVEGWRLAHPGFVAEVEGWASDVSGGTLRDRFGAVRGTNDGGFVRGVPFTSWDERALARIWVEAGLAVGRPAAELARASGGLTADTAVRRWRDQQSRVVGAADPRPAGPRWDVASMSGSPGFRVLVLAKRAQLAATPGVDGVAWAAIRADAGFLADLAGLAEERGRSAPTTANLDDAASNVLAGDRWSAQTLAEHRADGWRATHPDVAEQVQGWVGDGPADAGSLRDLLDGLRAVHGGGFAADTPFTKRDETALVRLWVRAGLLAGRSAPDLAARSGGLVSANTVRGWQRSPWQTRGENEADGAGAPKRRRISGPGTGAPEPTGRTAPRFRDGPPAALDEVERAEVMLELRRLGLPSNRAEADRVFAVYTVIRPAERPVPGGARPFTVDVVAIGRFGRIPEPTGFGRPPAAPLHDDAPGVSSRPVAAELDTWAGKQVALDDGTAEIHDRLVTAERGPGTPAPTVGDRVALATAAERTRTPRPVVFDAEVQATALDTDGVVRDGLPVVPARSGRGVPASGAVRVHAPAGTPLLAVVDPDGGTRYTLPPGTRLHPTPDSGPDLRVVPGPVVPAAERVGGPATAPAPTRAVADVSEPDPGLPVFGSLDTLARTADAERTEDGSVDGSLGSDVTSESSPESYDDTPLLERAEPEPELVRSPAHHPVQPGRPPASPDPEPAGTEIETEVEIGDDSDDASLVSSERTRDEPVNEIPEGVDERWARLDELPARTFAAEAGTSWLWFTRSPDGPLIVARETPTALADLRAATVLLGGRLVLSPRTGRWTLDDSLPHLMDEPQVPPGLRAFAREFVGLLDEPVTPVMHAGPTPEGPAEPTELLPISPDRTMHWWPLTDLSRWTLLAPSGGEWDLLVDDAHRVLVGRRDIQERHPATVLSTAEPGTPVTGTAVRVQPGSARLLGLVRLGDAHPALMLVPERRGVGFADTAHTRSWGSVVGGLYLAARAVTQHMGFWVPPFPLSRSRYEGEVQWPGTDGSRPGADQVGPPSAISETVDLAPVLQPLTEVAEALRATAPAPPSSAVPIGTVVIDAAGGPRIVAAAVPEWSAMLAEHRSRFPDGPFSAVGTDDFAQAMEQAGYPRTGVAFDADGVPVEAPDGRRWSGVLSREVDGFVLTFDGAAGIADLVDLDQSVIRDRTAAAARIVADILGAPVRPVTILPTDIDPALLPSETALLLGDPTRLRDRPAPGPMRSGCSPRSGTCSAAPTPPPTTPGIRCARARSPMTCRPPRPSWRAPRTTRRIA